MTLGNAFPAYRPATPIKSWADIPAETERAEIHGSVVKDFEPLRHLTKLSALEASCRSASQLSAIAKLDWLEVLVLHHLTDSFNGIRSLTRLKALKLFGFGAASLNGIESLVGLRFLQIDHAPKLTSLAALKYLKHLEWLSIMTPASWDAARKTIKITSFAPLAELRYLRYLRLTGIEPCTDGLTAIARLRQLEELDFSHVHTLNLEDYATLSAALPTTKGNCLNATYRLTTKAICKKCKESEVVWLTGAAPRAKRSLCPICDAKKLNTHVSNFEHLKTNSARHIPD